MDAIKCIKTRRSIRKFKPDPIPRELLMEILDCGRMAPSAMNRQAWQFIIVKDKPKLEELAKLKHPHSPTWLPEAPVAVAIAVDLMQSRNHWIADGSTAAENILLAAHALGLGGCWINIRFDDPTKNALIQKALGLDANTFPVCLIALGYPDEEPHEKQLKDIHSIVR